MNTWKSITVTRDIHLESICERLGELLKNNRKYKCLNFSIVGPNYLVEFLAKTFQK